MTRTLHFTALATAFFVAAVSASGYCDSFPSVAEEFASSTLVFVGRVTAASEVAIPSNSITGGTFYTVEAADVLKGAPPHRVQLYSENSSGRFPMRVGCHYLIFASYGTSEGLPKLQLAVNNCGNSAPLPKAKDTLATVRKLAKT